MAPHASHTVDARSFAAVRRTAAWLCSVALLGAAQAGATDATRAWRVTELARAGSDEVALGNRLGHPVATVATRQMRVLYALEQAIERAAEFDVELVIVEGRPANAFAGYTHDERAVVGINLSMLKLIAEDPHAAAALLGHEIAHLKLGHGKSREEKTRNSSVLGMLGAVALGAAGVPAASSLSNLTVAAIQSDYSRDNEREADYLGAIWAVEAGFDPNGAWRLHEAIARTTGGSRSPFFSTHPSGPERIATLKSLAARLSPGTDDR